ncbi:MAG: DNA mismatch repair protein MutS, partial [Planctomycetota bacterium]
MSSSKPNPADTPAMRQYKSFKDQYPGYILLFRMGDFYELFYEDAKIASRELGLALTSRSKGPSAIPLAGIPYHALDGYLARLIRAGHRVAICEQVEDASQAKGVVKRDVTQLVTPGTLTDEALLESREGNYLAAVFSPSGGKSGNGQVGIAWAELSSGQFWVLCADRGQVLDELTRIRPAEVLCPESSAVDNPDFRQAVQRYTGGSVTTRPPWEYDKHASKETLQEHFGTVTLEGFGLGEWDESVSAAGGIIAYLRETQKTALDHVRSIRRFDRAEHMAIDANTLRCLEVHRTLRGNSRAGSLLASIDKTVTGMGARLLERWLNYPLTGYSPIVARQDAVEELLGDRSRLGRIREMLGQTSNIDRIAANIALGRARPRELVSLGQTLQQLPAVHEMVAGCGSDLLSELAPDLTELDAPAELVARAIDPDCPNVTRDGGVIAAGYDQELDRLRRVDKDGQSWLAEYQASQAKRLGIANLKVGYNKVFGYYIEITHARAERAPADY